MIVKKNLNTIPKPCPDRPSVSIIGSVCLPANPAYGSLYNDGPVGGPIRITLEAQGLRAEDGKVLEVDAYLAAVGRKPNTLGLGLQELGVELDDFGCIVVGPGMETAVPGVYAAGDVVGRPYLASTGVAQGAAAVDSMLSPSNSAVQQPLLLPVNLFSR